MYRTLEFLWRLPAYRPCINRLCEEARHYVIQYYNYICYSESHSYVNHDSKNTPESVSTLYQYDCE